MCTEERAELKAAADEAKASLPKFACAHHAEFTVPTHLLGYVKEIAGLGGDIAQFVSPAVCERLLERVGK